MDPATALYVWVWFQTFGLLPGPPGYWIPLMGPYDTAKCDSVSAEYTDEFSDRYTGPGAQPKPQCSINSPKDTADNKGVTLWGWAPSTENTPQKFYWAAVVNVKDDSACQQILNEAIRDRLQCAVNQPSEPPQ